MKALQKTKEKAKQMKGFISARKFLLTAFLSSVMMDMFAKKVYATAPVTDPAEAKGKWEAVIDFILPWIKRLGGVVILIGAVEFGLAFKNDDAEGKTKGLRTVIAGCIVTAVGFAADTFLVD